MFYGNTVVFDNNGNLMDADGNIILPRETVMQYLTAEQQGMSQQSMSEQQRQSSGQQHSGQQQEQQVQQPLVFEHTSSYSNEALSRQGALQQQQMQGEYHTNTHIEEHELIYM